MRKLTLLAASVAIGISGCGGSSSSTPPETSFSITAIDGYLINAEVYVGEDCKNKIGETDSYGKIDVDAKYKDQPLCVKAVAGKTVDSSRGTVPTGFTISATANSPIVSPFTDLVVAKLDGNTDQQQAEQAVLTQFASITSDPDELFGDYIIDNSTNKTSQGLTVIGETLVDEDLDDDLLDELIDIVAEKVDNDDDDLDDFDPVIDPDNGTITENHRPHITLSDDQQEALEDLTAEQGVAIEPIDLNNAFDDVDNGDTFTIEVIDEDGHSLEQLGLTFAEGFINGIPLLAEDIDLQAYATDSHGARSYSLDIEFEVDSANLAPIVVDEKVIELEQELAQLALAEGSPVDFQQEIDDLFEDEDDLIFTVTTTIPGVNVTIEQDDELIIKGTPTAAGDYVITLSADDGNHDPVDAEIELSIGGKPLAIAAFLVGESVDDRRYCAVIDETAYQPLNLTVEAYVDDKYWLLKDGEMVETDEFEIIGNTVVYDEVEQPERFVYVSDQLALALPQFQQLTALTISNHSELNAPWSNELTSDTWHQLQFGDSDGTIVEINTFTFGEDSQVCVNDEQSCYPYSLVEGALTLDLGNEEQQRFTGILDDGALWLQHNDHSLSLFSRDNALLEQLKAEWLRAK